MIRRATQKWVDKLSAIAHTRMALFILFILALLKVLVLPLPIEMFLLPMLLLNRERVWLIPIPAILGSMAGGLIGYALGNVFFDDYGLPWITAAGYAEELTAFEAFFDENGFWAVFISTFAPLPPIQVGVLAAGLADYNIPLFLLAIGLGRAIRFYALALLVHLVGDYAEVLWKKHFRLVAILLLVIIALLLAGFQWL